MIPEWDLASLARQELTSLRGTHGEFGECRLVMRRTALSAAGSGVRYHVEVELEEGKRRAALGAVVHHGDAAVAIRRAFLSLRAQVLRPAALRNQPVKAERAA